MDFASLVCLYASVILPIANGQAKLLAFWPLNSTYEWNTTAGTFPTEAVNLTLAEGPCGLEDTAYQFDISSRSSLGVQHNGTFSVKSSFTLIMNVLVNSGHSYLPLFIYSTGTVNGLSIYLDRLNLFVKIMYVDRIGEHVRRSRWTAEAKKMVTLDEWNFIGIAYNHAERAIQFLINNETVSYQRKQRVPSATEVIFTPEQHLHIGAKVIHRPEYDDEDFFDGRMAEVRLYDGALTMGEMEELQVSCEKLNLLPTTTAVTGEGPTGTFKYRENLHTGYTRSPSPCVSEEWAYSNQTGNCYMFFGDEASHAEAIDLCKTKGGELLQIQNEDEQIFIDTILAFDYEDHWTLGKKEEESGNFTYAGTEIAWTNWLAEDLLTSVPDGVETCLYIVKNLFAKGFFLMKGKWDSNPCSEKKSFICQTVAKHCPELPSAQYVEPHPPKPFIELTIDYKCTPGYEMPNYTSRYLEWQQRKPTVNVTANKTEAWNAMKPNITTMPSMKYECLYPGKWSDGSLAPCEPISCKEPPDIAHADRNSTERVFPSWIEYKCEHGWHWAYDNSSVKVAWCGPDTDWIDVPPDCDPVECKPFPRVGNASVNSANNRFKETVVWTCNPGFMYPDRSVRQWVGCRENYVNMQIGRWNISRLDDCVPLECPDPPRPANTTMSSNDTLYRTVITYSCVSEEFEFPNGELETPTLCSNEARWKPMIPPCTKKAPKLKMKGKKYQPAAKESPSAETVGTLAVIIMSILMVITVLIDLGTCYRGLRFLRYNIKSFQRHHGM